MDLVTTIISAIQLAVAAAPEIANLYAKAKDFVTALFEAAVISKADQDAMHNHIDALQAAALAGTVPPAWSVEPDPS